MQIAFYEFLEIAKRGQAVLVIRVGDEGNKQPYPVGVVALVTHPYSLAAKH